MTAPGHRRPTPHVKHALDPCARRNRKLANEPSRPEPDFILDTGDNVYNEGTEDNYRDFFFPAFNSDEDSNETGGAHYPQQAVLSRRWEP